MRRVVGKVFSLNYVRSFCLQDGSARIYTVAYLVARRLGIGESIRRVPARFKCGCGYVFYARLDDYWRFINAGGHFEPLTMGFLLENVHRGDVVLDVGAHIGLYTVHLAKKVRHVVAVEPEPSNLRFLLRNIRVNNVYGKVTVVPAAACERDGRARLHIHHSSGGHSLIALEPSSGSIEVKCIRLDSLLESLGIDRVDVAKIDVEGYEFNVLRGFKRFLSSQPPRILVVETWLKPSIIDFIRRYYGYREVVVLDVWGSRGNVVFTR
jgi:FkbM family methyltransferase